MTLCTGNAVRSVMVGFMLVHWGQRLGRPLRVLSAGTHVIEGLPMSMRTRAALASIPALGELAVAAHRSQQLAERHLVGAHLVLGMEADHVRFVRAHHAEAAARCATLKRLSLDLEAGDEPLGQRVAALALAGQPLDPTEDVADPAGGDVETYIACAAELWLLTERLARRL